MCPKCDEWRWGSCREFVSIGQKGSKISSREGMDLCSALRWNGNVYKRRKLDRNSFVLLSGEDSSSSSNRISSCDLLKANTAFRSQIELVPSSASSSLCSAKEHGREQLFAVNLYKYASDCYSRVNVASASSKPIVGHGSSTEKIAVVNSGECSSVDEVIVESMRMFSSAKELCISALKSHGLLGGDPTSKTCTSLEVMHDNNQLVVSCRMCGVSENPMKMLICDLCDESFHESCCKPKPKVLPDEEWYCKPCLQMKRKTLRRKHKGKSLEMITSRKRKSHLESLLSLMLKDTSPHTSKVRVGKEFQAEVPDWSGPKYD